MEDGRAPTPGEITVILVVVFLIAVAGMSVRPYLEFGPKQAQIWNWFMDAVTLTSLGLTLLILSDLKEIQRRFLLRARLPNLQEDLKEKASRIGEALEETSGEPEIGSEVKETLSRTQGILKQICDRTEGIDDDTHTEGLKSCEETLRGTERQARATS
jgi:hypothetical protein